MATMPLMSVQSLGDDRKLSYGSVVGFVWYCRSGDEVGGSYRNLQGTRVDDNDHDV